MMAAGRVGTESSASTGEVKRWRWKTRKGVVRQNEVACRPGCHSDSWENVKLVLEGTLID